jgi:hypothetical protein
VAGAVGALFGSLLGAALATTAFTAAWQAGDSLARCCFRQANASAPPRGTPEQFERKSDRQEERIALTCSGFGCCASAGTASAINAKMEMARSRRSGILGTSSVVAGPIN